MTIERLSEPHLRLVSELDATVQLKVLSQLTGTLELRELIERIPGALREAVPVDGLIYLRPDTAMPVQVGRRSRHSVHYRLMPEDPENLGELMLFRGTVFKESELATIEGLLPLVVVALRNAFQYQRAMDTALTDPLTGVGNRLAMDTSGKQQLAIAHRHRLPCSLLMIDIDYFKRVNDSKGHAAGDQVLKCLADVVRSAVRQADMVYRSGGEEFVVLLPNTTNSGARAIAERIRVLVAASHQLLQLVPSGVTVSIGVASVQENEQLDALCDRADKALYEAKRQGRNRVTSAREQPARKSTTARLNAKQAIKRRRKHDEKPS